MTSKKKLALSGTVLDESENTCGFDASVAGKLKRARIALTHFMRYDACLEQTKVVETEREMWTSASALRRRSALNAI